MTGDLVLVIEDDADSLRIFATVLAHEGFSVEEARDGIEGLARALEEPPPRLVVLDLMLPRLDGLEVLRRLRSVPRNAAVPVLVVSADPMGEQAALAAGCDAFLTKPLRPSELVHVARELVTASVGVGAGRGGTGPEHLPA